MSETNFQRALIHLYANVDQYDSYSDALFEQFALSSSERQALEALMTSQRAGLLLFNQLLHDKRRRLIRQGLPKSQDTVGRQLETLLDDYLSCPSLEGTRDLADTMQSFTDFVGARIDGRTGATKELEFIRFEAVCASVSLRLTPSELDAPRPSHLSDDLRLSCRGDAALLRCTYDVVAATREPSLSGAPVHPLKPCWFFIFKARGDEVRILTVAPGLVKVLALFQSGLSLREVLRAFEREDERAAASASVKRLLSLEAPFFSRDEPAGLASASGEVAAG